MTKKSTKQPTKSTKKYIAITDDKCGDLCSTASAAVQSLCDNVLLCEYKEVEDYGVVVYEVIGKYVINPTFTFTKSK